MKISRIFFAAIAGATALAGELKIALPIETGTLKPGPGIELVQANCLTCHSVEYISTQPPMPRAFWEASVKKMREKYGAPATDDVVPKLVDYLSAIYGSPATPKR